MDDPEKLADLVERFTDAFNRNDLDAVMSFFAPDAFYDEFNGKHTQGIEAIRVVLEPQFRGDFGKIRFDTEDLFVDPKAGKVLIRWACVIEKSGREVAWRGLDIIHVRQGLIAEKHTYAKAEKLLLK